MIAMREYVTSVNGLNLQVIQALGIGMLNVVKRVSALNADARRRTLKDGAANIKALVAVKKAPELVGIEMSLAQLGLEKSMSYYQKAYAILATAENEVAEALEAGFAEFSKSMTASLEKAVSGARSASKTGVTATKSAMSATSTAVAAKKKAAEHTAEMAEPEVAALTQATVKLVHVGLPRAKQKRPREDREAPAMEPRLRSGASRKRAFPGGQ